MTNPMQEPAEALERLRKRTKPGAILSEPTLNEFVQSVSDERAALDWFEELKAERDRLREALDGIKWKSADKDNMEFAALITYSQMDAIIAALNPPAETQPSQND